MRDLQATPYVPGRAHGVLRYGVAAVPDSILVLSQPELSGLKTRPAGVIVVDGAPFSHPMLGLLGLGAPAVAVTAEQVVQLREGAEVLIDGVSGRIAAASERELVQEAAPPIPEPGAPVMTADGVEAALRASVRDASGAAKAVAHGAASIGLVRSEFLMPGNGSAPDRAFYKEALGALCEAARSLPVTVRLIDIAADKRPAWLPAVPGAAGPLGLQGTRLYEIEPVRSVFRAEVQAVGELAAHYDLRLLIPYVVRAEELRHWRETITGWLPLSLPFGTMAETPAAALELGDWFALADFIALGCNDLMQCLFAADRDVSQLRPYLDPYAPVLFRFLRLAAQSAGIHVDRVQVCGLLPQLPAVLPVMLGLGYRAFSVDPVYVPYLAQTVAHTRIDAAVELASAVCTATTSQAVREILGLPQSLFAFSVGP